MVVMIIEPNEGTYLLDVDLDELERQAEGDKEVEES